MQHAGIDVILCIRHVDIPCQRIYLDAVRFLYLRLCPVGDKVAVERLMRTCVDYGISDHILVADIIPRRGAGVE